MSKRRGHVGRSIHKAAKQNGHVAGHTHFGQPTLSSHRRYIRRQLKKQGLL